MIVLNIINLLFIIFSCYIASLICQLLSIKNAINVNCLLLACICISILFQAKFLGLGQNILGFPLNDPKYIVKSWTLFCFAPFPLFIFAKIIERLFKP